MLRIIGDVHGRYSPYHRLIEDVRCSLQLGDMGYGFRRYRDGSPLTNPSFDKMSKGEHKFIRGNHDNPEVCKNQKAYIPDGTLYQFKDFKTPIFCVGGAVSIDRIWRQEGFDWWADEECSYAELEEIICRYEIYKPSIVCTHECPESIANEILAAFNRKKIEDNSRTREALEQMFHIHQPKHWFFGHWHETMNFERGGTIFHNLGECVHYDLQEEEV